MSSEQRLAHGEHSASVGYGMLLLLALIQNADQGRQASWREGEQPKTQKSLALSERSKDSSLEYDSSQKSLGRWPA